MQVKFCFLAWVLVTQVPSLHKISIRLFFMVCAPFWCFFYFSETVLKIVVSVKPSLESLISKCFHGEFCGCEDKSVAVGCCDWTSPHALVIPETAFQRLSSFFSGSEPRVHVTRATEKEKIKKFPGPNKTTTRQVRGPWGNLTTFP